MKYIKHNKNDDLENIWELEEINPYFSHNGVAEILFRSWTFQSNPSSAQLSRSSPVIILGLIN